METRNGYASSATAELAFKGTRDAGVFLSIEPPTIISFEVHYPDQR